MSNIKKQFERSTRLKEIFPDYLVFIQDEDHFTCFDEDAYCVSNELGLTLNEFTGWKETSIPFHMIGYYQAELKKKGYRVSITYLQEQL